MGGRLKIWGSPVTECRLESMGKRYYSNAFERPKAERTRVYSAIPADAYYHTRTARRAEPVGRHDIEGQHRFRGNTSTVSPPVPITLSDFQGPFLTDCSPFLSGFTFSVTIMSISVFTLRLVGRQWRSMQRRRI